MKSLKEHLESNNPDRVAPFQTSMSKFAKEFIVPKFDEFRFYLGENMNIEGMVVLQFYRDDGLTPVFLFFKDGLKEEKYVRFYVQHLLSSSSLIFFVFHLVNILPSKFKSMRKTNEIHRSTREKKIK